MLAASPAKIPEVSVPDRVCWPSRRISKRSVGSLSAPDQASEAQLVPMSVRERTGFEGTVVSRDVVTVTELLAFDQLPAVSRA